MSERKVLNKYYPPDFDPSKIPRMKLPKNRQYTVRLMAPFNMRCKTCGEYIYKGKKFNARKEDVENQDYLGIRIYRFYIKCTRCLQEISFKTDPKNCDYEIEAGATRNFMALKLAEEQAQREENELKEEEANNPMKLLENRTIQSKNEIELLESLEELKDLNKRQQTVDFDAMLEQYDTRLSAQEIEEKLKQRDEEYIKTVKFQSSNKRKVVIEEEIIETDIKEEPAEKIQKADQLLDLEIKQEPSDLSDPLINDSTSQNDKEKVQPKNKSNWNRSIGSISRSKTLTGLVKINKKPMIKQEVIENSDKTIKNSENTIENKNTIENNEKTNENVAVKTEPSNGLSLLGAYSGSSSENSDND